MPSTYSLVQICLCAILTSVAALTDLKRQISQLFYSYDFIVAGGGTAGLTVADRLSEALPEKTILVIEYGEMEYARGAFDPPDIDFAGGSTARRPASFNYQSLPNMDVNNKTASVLTGKTVGGSSAINGMFFDRPSRFDLDAWAKATSPEFDASDHKWSWEAVFPYYKKSVTFTEPLAEYVDNYNYTWDVAVYGGSAPIYSCLPPFLWADHSVMRDAWQEMGIIVRKECAGGDKDGLCWVPTSEHPETSRRSHAGLGHYAEIMPRSNYHLLVKHQVTRIIYPRGIQSGPPIVEIRSLDDGQHANITAKAEVIIAAGTFQTPAILQRSGIGAISSLKAADIPVFHELPGVGANLQDHSGPALEWKYTKPGNFSPLPADMRDPAFAADAAAGFNETPARGPYTLAMGNSAIYMSLPNITANYANIVNGIRNMSGDGSTHSHLPIDYDNNPTLIAGYNRQLSVLADFYANPKAPSMEVPWATGTSFRAIMLHPLSRGTVRLNNTDHLAQPILDYRTASNPIDLDIHLAHLRYLRSTFDTPTMRRYGAVETDPGVAKQDAGSLRIHIKDGMTFSFLHPCCTAAMLPKELGGVVGPDLKVHGLKGLRVVDISVLPFLVSSHTSSTAYALGEKAADIIINSWSS